MILANRAAGCGPVPMWIGIPMGAVGLAAIVLTLVDLFRKH